MYSRDGNRWTVRFLGPGESVPLTTMPGMIEVDRVYAGVTLAPVPPRPLARG